MSVDKLIKKLTDKKAEVRETAVVELGKLGDIKAVEPLITRLKDDNENVRIWTAVSLGNLGDERAIEPLMKVVMIDSHKVKREAAGAIVKISPQYNAINIDEIIKKIAFFYKEYTEKKEQEQEKIGKQIEFEHEKNEQLKKQTQEKFFEDLQQKPEVELIPKTDTNAEHKTEVNEGLAKEEKIEEPEIGIEEFMSALKKAPINDRVEELSNVLTRAMNLFVNAIDDISTRLANIENNIEQRFQEIEKKVGGVPAIFPSKGQVPSAVQSPLQGPKPITQFSTRAALNEELKKTLHGRKVEG